MTTFGSDVSFGDYVHALEHKQVSRAVSLQVAVLNELNLLRKNVESDMLLAKKKYPLGSSYNDCMQRFTQEFNRCTITATLLPGKSEVPHELSVYLDFLGYARARRGKLRTFFGPYCVDVSWLHASHLLAKDAEKPLICYGHALSHLPDLRIVSAQSDAIRENLSDHQPSPISVEQKLVALDRASDAYKYFSSLVNSAGHDLALCLGETVTRIDSLYSLVRASNEPQGRELLLSATRP